ncbi:unnamed protein product [Bursaphelenchus okinawaensis]|uniref:F-box domain-containing protein n=1 Tax=Bursaphelenchus okinawaensis TaxID=465554 RepID=A0A811KQ04_9BILA|nr:unnamed protein product [Bursaphelenchus okinawaensis]CAG9108393.1 unnamed protein product [Bursaphelenchus okinawaensis]
MRIFANQLSAELWLSVIEYLDIWEDAISLAMVDKCFYKLVNQDFKQICYDHVIYRLKGETWAEAFADFATRTIRMMFVDSFFHQEQAVCCPFTGKMAIKYDNGYVVLTNLDFGRKEFTIIDFTSYTNQITHVNMINRGTELLIRTPTFVLVYDMYSMKVIQQHDMIATSKGLQDMIATSKGLHGQMLNYQIIKNGSVFDLYTRKEFKIDAQTPKGYISYISVYDKSKYIAVHTKDNFLVIINSKTNEKHQVCEWTAGMKVYVINENDSVFVLGDYYDAADKIGLRIYSIKKQKIVFEEPNVRYWQLYNFNTLFQRSEKKFLTYNKTHDCWIKTKYDTNLLLCYRYGYFSDFGFLPSPTYKIAESQRYTADDELIRFTFFRFKKDSIRVRRFSAEIEERIAWDIEEEEQKTDKYQVKKLMNLKFPVLKENSTDFYNWFVKLHIANDCVPLIDAKTNVTQYYNFYLLKPN